MTYNDLYNNAVCAAQNIRRLNFKKGDVFAVVSKNNPEVISLLVALLSLVHPINTLDPSLTEEIFVHILGITNPKLIFCELESFGMVRGNLNNHAKIYTFCGQRDDSTAVSSFSQRLVEKRSLCMISHFYCKTEE